MVRNVVLLDKIYNIKDEKQLERISSVYLSYLNRIIGGFPSTSISLKKLRNFDQRFEIVIKGPEEVFVHNILKKEVGLIQDYEDLKIGEKLQGNLKNPGKVGFGIFVDCGIMNPLTDVLISLHSLRKQLCGGNKLPARKIIKVYDFIDNFPVFLKIIEIDKSKKEIYGEFDQRTLDLFKRIVDEKIDAIFISGATKNQIKKAIERKGHFKDVISVKRFGFLEHIALLKEGTQAPGIISRIGPSLRNVKISAMRSDNITELYK